MIFTMHRPAIFLLVATMAFIAWQSADAGESIFTIDRNLSSVKLVGNDYDFGPLGHRYWTVTATSARSTGTFFSTSIRSTCPRWNSCPGTAS